MSIIYRTFQSADFAPALQFYNEYGKADKVTERMWKRLVILDPNFDPEAFIIAEDENGIAGLVYVIHRLVPIDTFGDLEKEKAWINAFAVKTELVETVGRSLIAKAEEIAKNWGAKVLAATSYTPNYFTQGIDAVHHPHYVKLFNDCGYFIAEDSNSMALDLSKFEYSETTKAVKGKLEDEGITFETLSNERLWALFEYMRKYSKPGWTSRIRKLLLDTDDLTRVHIACDGDKVIGFNINGDPDTSIMRFGPYGVADDYRGRKIGKVLLEECLQDMKASGLSNAWLQWASGDVAPGLYRRIGFEITGRYLTFRKLLNN